MNYSESLNDDYHNLGDTKKKCCTPKRKCCGAVTLFSVVLIATTACLTVYFLGGWPKSAEDVREAPFSDYQNCTKQDECKELGYNYMCVLNVDVHENSGYCLPVDKCQKDEDCPPNRNLTCNTNPELELQGQGFCQAVNLPSNATATPSGTTPIGDSLPDDYWTKLKLRLATDPRHKISDGGSGINQVTRPFNINRKSLNFTGAGPCDKAACDDPSIRDTYNGAPTQNVKLNFHLVRSFQGQSDKDLENDVTASFQIVQKNWASAFNFEGKIHWYDSSLLKQAIAGDGPACLMDSENMKYKSSRSFAVYKSETVACTSTVFNTEDRKNVKLFAGDAVKIRVDTESHIETCVVSCADTFCVENTEVKCWDNLAVGANEIEVYTMQFEEKAYVQYAVRFTNKNSVAQASIDATIEWGRTASCLASEAWKANVHNDWATRSAYNVYVSDFGLAAGLNGFGAFPFGPTDDIGALFMGRHVINGEATTLAHEFGHDVGLMHTFTGTNEQRCPGQCAEFYGQSNANVGDFCEDTGPMNKAWDCRAPTTSDCTGVPFGKTAPWDNIMSYGTCREKLTPNQEARAKCYNDKMVSKIKP